MILRRLNIHNCAEIDKIADLAEMFHAQSRFKNLTFSRQKVCGLLIGLGQCSPLIAYTNVVEIDGEIVGGMFAALQTPHYSDDAVIQDYGIYVDPTKRSSRIGYTLVNDLIEWAKSSNACEIWLGESAGIEPEAVRRLYEHFGFTQQGTLYRRMI